MSPTSTSAIVCSTKRYKSSHICSSLILTCLFHRLHGITTNTQRRSAPVSSVEPHYDALCCMLVQWTRLYSYYRSCTIVSICIMTVIFLCRRPFRVVKVSFTMVEVMYDHVSMRRRSRASQRVLLRSHHLTT